MRWSSIKVAIYFVALIVAALTGNVVTYVGIGTASERLSKRIRDSTFTSLLRQEVGYFDKRSVGTVTSQLQYDAARIHAFSGEPLRNFIIAIAAVLTGLIIALAVRCSKKLEHCLCGVLLICASFVLSSCGLLVFYRSGPCHSRHLFSVSESLQLLEMNKLAVQILPTTAHLVASSWKLC